MAAISRRQLLARLILAGAAISRLPAIAAAGRSRVVIPHETSVFEGEKIAAPVLQGMLDRSVAKMVGTSRAADAWKQLFSASDVVGIKTNSGFGSGASTHVELIRAVIQGLRSAGVREDNIIVWDHTTSALIRGGLRPNRTGPGVRYYGCDKEWGPVVRQGVFEGRICKVLAEMATAVVNVPALKKHHRCGISCALKNHFGSIEEPEKLHDVRGPYVDPGIADVSAIPAIRKKTRLVVVDALRAQYEAGPGAKLDAQWSHCSLLVSRDPVAVDAVGLEIIQTKRTALGLPRIGSEWTPWLRSAQERGIGICDLSRIEIVNV